VSERLQKFLARAGVASRRHAEGLITAGRVSVNNQRVTELGTKVEPTDLVMVDGQLVTVPEHTSWYLLHKPPGVVTTLSDPEGRPTVAGLLEGVEERVFPVGRLDWDAEGALLLTNDGGAAHRLLHPSFEVPRTYLVKVKGTPTDETLARLQEGVRLEDGPARALRAERFEATERNTWLLLQVSEGRPHLVKRMAAAVGHPVVRLFRPAQAGVSVAGLQPGELRQLTAEEVQRVEAIAAGGSLPEPAPFLPPRRHGRAGDDEEALDAGEGSGAEGISPEPVQRASAEGALPGRDVGGLKRGRTPEESGNGRRPKAFGGRARAGEGRPGPRDRAGRGDRRSWGADDGSFRSRGRGAERGGAGERGASPRGRDAGEGGRGGRRSWGSEDAFRPRGRAAGRSGFGEGPARGAGGGEGGFPPRGRGGAPGRFGDRPPRGAGAGGFRPRARDTERGASGDRPGREAAERDARPRGRGGDRGGFGDRPRRGPGEGGFRRTRDTERGGFGDRPPRRAGEGGFRPRPAGTDRGGFGDRPQRPAGEGGFRPRPRDTDRGGSGDRPRRGPGEGGFRPRARDTDRGGFTDRPRRGAGEGGSRPRGPGGRGGGADTSSPRTPSPGRRGSFGRGRSRLVGGPRAGGWSSTPSAPRTGGRSAGGFGSSRGPGRFGTLPRGGGARRPRPGPRGGGGGGRGGGRR
jgi:23S rRNA pseudouridine2605 synthase